MKRNRNFFLMWMVLFTLFAVTVSAGAQTATNAYYAPIPSLYWSGGWDREWADDSVIIVETTPLNFVDTITNYTAMVPYDAKYLRLHVRWDSVAPKENPDTIRARVFDGTNQIWANQDKSADSWYDSVYVVDFKSRTDFDIAGRFEYDMPTSSGSILKSYNLNINRAQASTVSTLKYLTVAYTKVAVPDAESWKAAFEHMDEKSKYKYDSVLLREFNATSPVLAGRYVADSVNAGDKIALRLEKTSPLSTLTVSQKGKVITHSFMPWGETHPVYAIDPNAQVEITVTAQDGVAKSVYAVVVYSRLSPPNSPVEGAKLDSISTGEPHLGDLWLQDANDKFYTLGFDTVGQMSDTIHPSNFTVSVPVGVHLFVNYEWRADSVKNGASDNIWTIYSNGKVQTYPAGDTAFTVKLLDNHKNILKNYNIALKHPDLSLSRFILSKDEAGSDVLEPDGDGRFTAAFNVDSVFLSFAAKDTSYTASNNFDFAGLKSVGKEITVTGAKKYEFKYKLALEGAGLSRTFGFTVKDGSEEKNYTAVVKRKTDFSLKSFSLKIGDTETVEVDPEKLEDVKVPTGVEFADIEVEAEPASDLVTAVKSIVGVDGSYVARVRVYVKGHPEEGDFKYEVNLRRYSQDASLKRLLVTPGDLSPAFAPEVKDYSVSVPYEQDFIFFVTETTHEGASVSGGDGKQDLPVGDSTFEIVITAEDEVTTETYKIKVTRESGTGIASLSAQSIQVYADGQALHVITPAAEQIGIYSVGGKLLYSVDKPAGKVSLQGLPKGILVIKGSSGWVKKAVI